MRFLIFFLFVTDGFMVGCVDRFVQFLEEHLGKFKRAREGGYLLRESGCVFLKKLACDGHQASVLFVLALVHMT